VTDQLAHPYKTTPKNLWNKSQFTVSIWVHYRAC